jgi:hypothetical protein
MSRNLSFSIQSNSPRHTSPASTSLLAYSLGDLYDVCMQVVKSITGSWMSNSSVALVNEKGQIILEDGLDHAEQDYCADVINRHLQAISGSIEIEKDLETLIHALI